MGKDTNISEKRIDKMVLEFEQDFEMLYNSIPNNKASKMAINSVSDKFWEMFNKIYRKENVDLYHEHSIKEPK